MALTDSRLHYVRKARLPAVRWSWAQSAGFIFFSCGLFWVAVIAVAWRYL